MNEYLICDIGNSRAKYAIFADDKLKEIYSSEITGCGIPHQIKNRSFNSIISSFTLNDSSSKYKILKKEFPNMLIMSSEIEIPIKLKHKTPKTLGQDRKAACVGASFLFPEKDLLIIDVGSALTIDLVTKNEGMIGGIISPGLNMRFRALNNFSGNLPLLKPEEETNLLGISTNESIQFGVQNGIISEVEWYIEEISDKYPEIKLVLTGGDAGFFAKNLKNSIFVEPNLVLIGLYRILKNYVA